MHASILIRIPGDVLRTAMPVEILVAVPVLILVLVLMFAGRPQTGRS